VTARRILLLTVAGMTLATGRVAAQFDRVKSEWGAQVTGTTGKPAFLGAGAFRAWRPGLRDRAVVHAALGSAEHQVGLRAEATWQFLISPQTERGLGAYVGGGIAGQFAESNRGWLVLLVGLEQNPAARRGWSVELGIGGGIRLAAGYRWRR